MAISTQTQDLIDFYTQKNSLDKKQLDQINFVQQGYTIQTGIGETEKIKVWGPNEIIENYTSSIKKIDSKVLELNSEIVDLQNRILILGQNANSIGCGTTGIFEDSPPGFTTITVNRDQLNYRGYSYSGNNPFSPTGGEIVSGNLGIGTENYISQVSIGTYFGPVGTCNSSTCTGPICVSYANSITELQNQILPIQNERNGLITTINFLKKSRSNYELQNYSYEQSKAELNSSIQESNTILEFLNNPANDEWL